MQSPKACICAQCPGGALWWRTERDQRLGARPEWHVGRPLSRIPPHTGLPGLRGRHRGRPGARRGRRHAPAYLSSPRVGPRQRFRRFGSKAAAVGHWPLDAGFVMGCVAPVQLCRLLHCHNPPMI
jgi:hypothetical protein